MRTHPCAVLLIGVMAAACGSDPPAPKVPVGRSKPAPSARAELPGLPGLPSALVASLEQPDATVAFAHRGDRGLAAFTQAGRLYTRVVETASLAVAEAADLGPIGRVGAFSVKAQGDGYLLFWGERVDQNHLFKVLALDASGKPRSAVVDLPPIPDAAVTYADIAILGDAALVVHEVMKGELSSVFVTPVPKGPERALPRAVVEGALAWSATQTPNGLALAVVRSSASAPKGRALGTIEIVVVDKAGTARPPVPAHAKATAEVDVEIAAIEGGLVLAWTDVAEDSGAVRAVILDESGSPRGTPTLLSPPIGDQALVGLVADSEGRGKRALVAWENLGQRVGRSRIIETGTVGGDGRIGKERTRFLLDADDRPDFTADGDGFALLTLAPVRTKEQSETAPVPSWPAFVDLGPDLTPRSGEPVRFVGARAREGVPEATYGLSCRGGRCFALASDLGPPSSHFLVSLSRENGGWRAPAWRAEDERPPKILALSTVADGARVSAARATRLGGDGAPTLSAWVTYHLDGTTPTEAAPRGEAPFAATLALRPLTNGVPGDPVVLSRRALSPGGVSIAPVLGGKRPEALVAWVASDKGTPQVFATKVDATGAKLAQKKVTVVERAKKKEKEKGAVESASLALDVAVAHSPIEKSAKGEARGTEGFVLAWIDTRDGDGELYAARINKDLEKTVVDKRLTTAKGDASEVSLLVRGSDAFIAFAEARDGKPADIYFTHLDAMTLREIDEDARVYASVGPSRAPRLFSLGDRLLLAWIEDPAPGEAQASTLRIGELERTGRLVGAPRVVAAPEGASLTGFSITCSGTTWSSCRGVVSWARPAGRPEIGGLAFVDDPAAPPAVVRLGSLTSGPFADPSLSLADPAATELFYVEDAGDKGRLRRVSLGW